MEQTEDKEEAQNTIFDLIQEYGEQLELMSDKEFYMTVPGYCWNQKNESYEALEFDEELY